MYIKKREVNRFVMAPFKDRSKRSYEMVKGKKFFFSKCGLAPMVFLVKKSSCGNEGFSLAWDRVEV